ncbi:MAG: hypothetical protein DI533_10090 [Cereibacter sphaeroides]|uniref:Uncharacterized protein n=1 Tax=Cereibacter sphaeroides TaxID=1063 RepID=A0A2W5TXE8_CERSP|nr:MAG: hypothetical protein DI533_10090 [Cereibacter sphaeroides]
MTERLIPELQAVLVVDAIGFTSRMEHDPDGCIQAMIEARLKMLRACETEAGQVVDTPGDFILAVFPSVKAALSAARIFTAKDGADDALPFRAAIDIGEVYPVDGKLLGAAINTAARLQELAGQNGIVLSERAYQSLARRERFQFALIGEIPLKNIERPVRAYQLARGARYHAHPLLSTSTQMPVVFVCGFRVIGQSKRARIFAESLSEELVTVLGAIRGLMAIRTPHSTSPEHPGHEISGQIRDGEVLRVTAQLRSVPDGEVLWTGRFDCADTKDFRADEEISRRVVEAIQLTLSDGEWTRLWSEATTTLQAWEHFQQGRVLEASATRDGLLRAKEHFRSAIAADNSFVTAKVALGFCLVDEVRLGLSSDPAQSRAQIALLLDEIETGFPADPYGRALKAFCKSLNGHHAEACEIMHGVVQDCPESPELLSYYAVLLEYDGQLQAAITIYERALRLTRYPPAWIRTNLALARMILGDPSAKSMFELDIRSNPRNVRAHVGMVAAEAQDGRIEAARYWADRLRSLEPDFKADRWRDTVCFSDLSIHRRVAESLRLAGL